jgi:hypothetical protein
MRTLNATYKGLAAGLLMVFVSLLIYNFQKDFDSNLRYLTYAIYAGGIYWAISSYSSAPGAIKTFRSYFSQGFKCFIVITLMMVSFTYILIKSDPSLEARMAENQRIGLEEKGNLTPAEIEKNGAFAREYYVTMSTSSAIFGYLAIGAFFTAVVSLILIRTKGKNIDQDHTSFTGTKI